MSMITLELNLSQALGTEGTKRLLEFSSEMNLTPSGVVQKALEALQREQARKAKPKKKSTRIR